MEKRFLINILNDILKPYGFKKKGNNWMLDGGYLVKKINLQRSFYSNSYYINYGYIIKALHIDLGELDHIGSRLGSNDREEQEYITMLLDLDSDIPMDERIMALKQRIEKQIISEFLSVNDLIDLRELIEKKNILAVPIVVKEYLDSTC